MVIPPPVWTFPLSLFRVFFFFYSLHNISPDILGINFFWIPSVPKEKQPKEVLIFLPMHTQMGIWVSEAVRVDMTCSLLSPGLVPSNKRGPKLGSSPKLEPYSQLEGIIKKTKQLQSVGIIKRFLMSKYKAQRS